MNKKQFQLSFSLVCITLACLSILPTYAQRFALPIDDFSRNKPAYFIMADGSKVEANLDGFKRTKGLIETIKIEDAAGNKSTLDPANVVNMYLAPSTFGKMNAAMEKLSSWRKLGRNLNIDTTLVDEGYVFFEKVPTILNNGDKDDLMLQLLNGSFAKYIGIYDNPIAVQVSANVGGIGIGGNRGLETSYYIRKVGEEAAYRLDKNDYDKELFEKIFGDCPEVMAAYGKKPKWSDLEKHVYEYSVCMDSK
ncbi:MAG TPA: hypothetical protein DCM08_08525 [Microscillaceae bacterium]|jgi:hypothetical protein|nr:hypothetical protein [Microscillaceae bacterium]